MSPATWQPGDPLPRPEDVIPHRPPFLLVDEITENIPEISTSGHWTPGPDLPFFGGHFPGYPVVPGVLLIESLAQVGAIGALLAEGLDGDIPFFGGIDKARFRRQVRPGEKIDLHVEVTQRTKRAGKATGFARVDGELACQTGLFFLIVNRADLPGL